MSYSLFRVHWRIEKNGQVENKVSFHETEDDFVIFLSAERNRNSGVKYKTQGISEVHHANGNLRNEVLKAKSRGKYGIWKNEQEVVLH